MYDKELALEILRQIEEAADKIIVRFASIRQASDFVESTGGIDKLDAICMMLIVIGESLKNLDKITGGDLLRKYPQVDWRKAKGMRDILTHQYADINAEAVFHTCRDKIPQLLQTIKNIRNDQEKETGPFLEQQ